jgi:transposase
MTKQLSEFEKGKIMAWNKVKKPNRWIAKQLGRAESSIRYFLKKFRRTNSIKRKVGSGANRKTSVRQDNMIKRLALQNRSISRSQIIKTLKLNVSKTTVTNRMKVTGLKSRVAPKKPFVSAVNVKKRLQWAKSHKSWSIEQWEKVLFSDESLFVLSWSGKKMVWRRMNEKYIKECIRSTVKQDNKKLMMWGCFCANGIGNLHQIHGNMDAKMYKNILIYQMRPIAKKLFPNGDFIFQHDNCKTHTANIIKKYLKSQKIQTLDWPAQSPDLNPIENLWKIIKEKVGNKNPTNIDEYYQILLNEWKNIDSNLLKKLIATMPKRCNDVIKNKGYPIKY